MAVVEGDNDPNELIPGLPNEIAELCLLQVPYPYQALSRSVSSTWNRAITHPSFIFSKKTLSHPHLFVLAFHSQTAKLQWQSFDFDPSSGKWFLLPKMPLPQNFCISAFASAAALPRHGKLFVVNNTHSLVYRAATNQWAPAAPTLGGKLFCAAVESNGRIVAVGRGGADIYDPESDTWREGKSMLRELERYEVVAVDGKVYVTEGWWWPFMFRPRGWVYEFESDTWHEMRIGMRDGWTGLGVAVKGMVFVIAEYGDSPVKVYDEDSDTWHCVGGDRFPRELLKRPFSVTGLDDRIYVASSGLNIAIGSVHNNNESAKVFQVSVTWHVVEAPKAFREFTPCSCHVLYA